MTEDTGHQIHMKAEQTRESGAADAAAQALKLAHQSYIAYEIEGNKPGMAKALSSASIARRHRWQETGERSHLEEALGEQIRAVAIARESGERTAVAIPLFQLANVQEAMGNLSDAVATYGEAVDEITHNAPESDNRPAVVANFKVHAATCAYKNGDKSALIRAEESLHELEAADEQDAYAKDVWVSGGYMRFADMLRGDNPTKARSSLQRAKEIIDANPALKKRKEQWRKLAATFQEE